MCDGKGDGGLGGVGWHDGNGGEQSETDIGAARVAITTDVARTPDSVEPPGQKFLPGRGTIPPQCHRLFISS